MPRPGASAGCGAKPPCRPEAAGIYPGSFAGPGPHRGPLPEGGAEEDLQKMKHQDACKECVPVKS